MARFYARFDSGSESTLDNDYFDRRRIGADSASGALLKIGLISSRSAVSADVYDDLDSQFRSFASGTYFPPDASTFPTSTLISWSTAYTSSVLGIKSMAAADNTYGGTTVLNYSRRPTGSVLSTQTTLTGPTNPLDPVQLNYNVYLSASNAVAATLNVIQSGSGANLQTPTTRTSNNLSRTLHSLWHNPTLDYFAWDDFTPGTPVLFSTPINAGGGIPCVGSSGGYTYSPTIRFFYQGTYKNDLNTAGKIRIIVNWVYPGVGLGANSFAPTIDDTIIVTGSAVNGGGYQYDKVVTFYADDTDDAVNLTAKVTMSFYDAIIDTSQGSPAYNDTLTVDFVCPTGP